jgi:hypothetical protein
MAGLPWVKVWTVIGEHPKVQRLERELGIKDALGVVVRLWCWTAKYYPDGDIPAADRDAVGRAARGDLALLPSRVTQGCVTAGFLDAIPTGYRVHDWAEMQTTHVEAEEKRKAQSRERQAKYRERHGIGNATVTRNVTRDTVTETEKEKETETRAVPATASTAPEPQVWEVFRDLLADRMVVPRDWLKVASADRASTVREQISTEVTRLGIPRALEVAAEAATKAKGKPRWLAYFVGPLQDATRAACSQDSWQDGPRSEVWRDEKGRTLSDLEAMDPEVLARELADGGIPS